jgi:hypothetical protein
MKRLAYLLLLLSLLATAAFAQEDEQTPPDSPPETAPPAEAGDPPVPVEPVDPNAPLIVGEEKQLPGPTEQTQPKCECCGLYWAQSPTRIEAVVKRGGAKEDARYESIGCMLRDIAKNELKLLKFSIIDYSTAGTQAEVMLAGAESWYVYGARPIPGSAAPFIAAFAEESDARTARSWLDGDATLSWDALQKRYTADLAKAAETGGVDLPLDAVIPPGEDWFVCPCAGGCCDHIKADAEGECPDCGMTLVRRSEKLRRERERRGIKPKDETR